jgi:hypothetical protein
MGGHVRPAERERVAALQEGQGDGQVDRAGVALDENQHNPLARVRGLEDLRADPVIGLVEALAIAAPVPRLTDNNQHDVGAASRRDQLLLERAPSVERHRVEEDTTLSEPVDERRTDQ